jgi:hypothetical protein
VSLQSTVLVGFLAFCAMLIGAMTFCRFQSQLTERACIAAGRAIWNGHCSYPMTPRETRIE